MAKKRTKCKRKPKANQQLTVRTVHTYVHIIVHHCHIQHSTEEF